jgi:hypothetical protein
MNLTQGESSMPHRAWLLAAAIGSVIAVAGCSATVGDPTAPGSASEIPRGAAAVSYQIIEEVSTSNSAISDNRRLVIRDTETWEAFWDEFTGLQEPKPEAPAVDFATRMVIAGTMGQRTSGGFYISMEEVAELDATLYALVQETSPGARCAVTTALTAPAVAVSVPRHDGDVAFVNTEKTTSCAP